MNCLSPLFLLSLHNVTNCFADHGYSSRLLFLLSVFCLHAHWVSASRCCRIRLSPFCFIALRVVLCSGFTALFSVASACFSTRIFVTGPSLFHFTAVRSVHKCICLFLPELFHGCVISHDFNAGLSPFLQSHASLVCSWRCELMRILQLGPLASRVICFWRVPCHSLFCNFQCVVCCMFDLSWFQVLAHVLGTAFITIVLFLYSRSGQSDALQALLLCSFIVLSIAHFFSWDSA